MSITPQRPRRWLRRAAGLLLVLGLVLLCAEGGSRLILAVRTGNPGYLTYPRHPPVEMQALTSPADLPPASGTDPRAFHGTYERLTPGVHEFRRGPGAEVEHEITINQDGFRGRTFGDPPGARWELVCMGGSSTFCGSIPMGGSWPEVLERVYVERYGAGSVAVINRGIPGMSLLDVVELFEEDVADRKPDLVLIYSTYNSVLGAAVRVDLRPATTSPLHRLLWGRSLYYTTMLNRHLVRQQRREALSSAIESQVAAYVEGLDRLRELARDAEVRLLYVVQPLLDPDRVQPERIRHRLNDGDLEQFEFLAPKFREDLPVHEALNQAMIDHAGAHDVPLVDPRSALLDVADPENYFQIALHLTPAGAEKLATEIVRSVDERYGSLEVLIE